MNKLIVVAGPTASGKTDKAIEIALQCNGVLINADSRQIYKHLDIGTNKGEVDLVSEIEISGANYPVYEYNGTGIKIHLLSFLDPDQRYSVAEYQRTVFELIRILPPEVTLILVGGTGLYISAIIDPDNYNFQGITPESRAELEKQSVTELKQRAIKLAPEKFHELNESDQSNPQRLVRLLERVQSVEVSTSINFPKFSVEKIYLDPGIDILTEKINNRVELMFSEGLVEEVKGVLAMGYSKASPGLTGTGYKEVIQCLDGEISLDECKSRIKITHRQYAKRQRTWFRKHF